MNGVAFMWGEDLVIKKYKPKDTALNYGPGREIKALDSLFENKVKLGDSQKGLYAFIAPMEIHILYQHRYMASN